MRAIFCGTPEIAVPSLNALADIAEIVGVVCQPDRPAGRGMKLRPPAVKIRALELGLEVFQPQKVKDGTLARWIEEREADVALVIAYGRILTAETLSAPRLGCVNLHASLLPEYRGAAPIQRVLIDGKSETGVCLMQMDEGMDTGDVLACHKLEIAPNETAGELATRLGELAATVTREELPRFVTGALTPKKQKEERATYAPPITRNDGVLDFTQTAIALANRVRGLSPRPGATCLIKRSEAKDRRLKVIEARPWNADEKLAPGEVFWVNSRLVVGTGSIPLEIIQAQPDGKKVQRATDLKNGRVLLDGDKLA